MLAWKGESEWRRLVSYTGVDGLDYADQRYYASGYGRFNTADQYQASAGPGDPGTWNRYAYVGGDPVNFADPGGRDRFSCAIYGSRCDSAMTDCGLGVDGPANGLFSGLDPIAMVTCSGYSPIWPVDGFAGSSSAPQCPLVGLVGVNYKTDPNSPTPVHVLFAPGVAAALDAVFATLNTKYGITPILEDGFRTTSEQSDRQKKYKIAAKLGWHEVGRAIDFQKGPAGLDTIEKVMEAAGFVNGRFFTNPGPDVGHFQMTTGGVLTQAAADACSAEHPNGY